LIDRDEFAADDDRQPPRRSPQEYPEPSYRRGFQQGIGTVIGALLETGAVGEQVASELERYAARVHSWRYPTAFAARTPQTPLSRILGRDNPPRLCLTGEMRKSQVRR
jgi:hypothetical protein